MFTRAARRRCAIHFTHAQTYTCAIESKRVIFSACDMPTLLYIRMLNVFHLAISMQRYTVDSKRVQHNCTTDTLLSAYDYQSTQVSTDADGRYRVVPTSETLIFRTKCRVPRVGCMLVGWGGNNGSTVTACVLANKMNLKWRTKKGVQVNMLSGWGRF